MLDLMLVLERPGDHQRLVRGVRVVRGAVTMEAECRPAFDYARKGHRVHVGKKGAVFEGSGASLGLATDVPLAKEPGGAVEARFTLKEGEKAAFVLSQLAGGEDGPGEPLSAEAVFDLLWEAVEYWRSWLSRCTYHGRWREMVHRSALALKLLVYDPTGALVAAPTMGLPETIGGSETGTTATPGSGTTPSHSTP